MKALRGSRPRQLQAERERIAEGAGFLGSFEFAGFADCLQPRLAPGASGEFIQDSLACGVADVAGAIAGAAC